MIGWLMWIIITLFLLGWAINEYLHGVKPSKSNGLLVCGLWVFMNVAMTGLDILGL
jgi:hypothetical protein